MKIKNPIRRIESLTWTRRDLHPFPRLSKTEFYFINYGPKVHRSIVKQKELFYKNPLC